jgi:hypothetical protein
MSIFCCKKILNLKLIMILTLLFLFFTANSLLAHGVIWEESSKRSYGVEFSYDDGSIMSFVEVKVFGPNDESLFYQTGRTNEFGTYAFIPSEDGKWLVTADDGNGHLAKADIEVKTVAAGDNAVVAAPTVNVEREVQRAVSGATKPYKMFLVIVIFIALALAWKVFLAKKSGSPKSASGAK